MFVISGIIPREAFAYDRYRYPGWGWPHMMSWDWMSWRWGGMFGIGLLALIVILALIFVVFQRYRISPEPVKRTGDTPMEVLQKRYAKGEISRDEFLKIKEDLKE